VSRTALNEVLDLSLLDATFREAILTDPDRALQGYDLTDEERSALLSQDFMRVSRYSTTAANLIITANFVINLNENLVAIRPHVDEDRKPELRARGAEIARMPGDRTQPIKELLALMR
jgi:hypothetical protein